MTGIVTASMISLIMPGSDIRATPPSTRISAGTRSRAMTAAAPASSAMRACRRERTCQRDAILTVDVCSRAYLLRIDDVHDHTTLQHLGQTGLDRKVVGGSVLRGHFECGIEGEDEYGEGEGEKRRGGKVRKLKENRSCVSQTPIKEPWNTFPAKVVVVSDQLENANGEIPGPLRRDLSSPPAKSGSELPEDTGLGW